MAALTLRNYQQKAVEAVEAEFAKPDIRSTLIVLATGCHAKGERILLSSGVPVKVEDVKRGDRIAGFGGSPRRVLALHRGVSDLYRIVPTKGDPFVVTGDHILSLVRTARSSSRNACESYKGGVVVDVSVRDWIRSSDTFKHLHKLFRSERCDFDCATNLPLDPYFLGVLLGDGNMKHSIGVTKTDGPIGDYVKRFAAENGWGIREERDKRSNAVTWHILSGVMGCKGSDLHRTLKDLGLRGCDSGDKFIPEVYMTASWQGRASLLAGLLDTDGGVSRGGYDFISKSKKLSEGVAFVARSLGLAAYVRSCEKRCGDFVGTYHRVSISGDCSFLPCILKKAKPRAQKKSVLRTAFSVVPVGRGEYFGFTVDGDNRYLLADFTVTHNCGKTIVFSELAAREVRRGRRVLILAHRGELLEQAIDKLQRATGIRAGLEKADVTADVDYDDMPFTVVVGSVQSMCRPSRLSRFAHDEFSLVIIDECHHALGNSYKLVLNHFPKAKLLGVTATPDRGDLQPLSEVFQTISFEYSIVEAIKDGYLSPIRAQTIPLQIDLTSVAKQAGDYQAAGLGSALDPYLHQICREIKRRCADRKTIVFTPLIATSRKMLAIFEQEGISEAREVNGESDNRAATLEWFSHAPKGCVLLNSMLLTEGYDEPSVDCIVVLRATKVRALFVQMVGRGTRLYPGKKNLLLLDFLWLTSTHDLCRPACILSDNQNICELITRKQEKSAGTEDMDITPDLVDAAESEFTRKTHDNLAKRLQEQARKKGKLVDPLEYAANIGAFDLKASIPSELQDGDRPTMAQVDQLEKLGFACPGSASAAEKLLTAYRNRVDKGLASPRQIRFLKSRGFRNVENWTFKQGDKLIKKFIIAKWRLPRGINPETYQP